MLVQRVVMPVSSLESWTVLGEEGGPVEPIERYLAYLPRIVNYTRSARSVPTRPGDAPVPSPVRPGLRVRRLPPELG